MTAPIVRPINPAAWDWDPLWLVEQARQVLAMSSTDPDVPRLTDLAYATIHTVMDFLDWETDYVPPDTAPDPVAQACVIVLVEQYQRKNAPFGITGAWGADGVAMRVSRDWADPVRYLLTPYKRQHGMA